MEKTTEWKTDKLKLLSEKFGVVTVEGFTVEIRRVDRKENSHFCLYVELPKSENLSDSFLSYPTLREGDIIGVDTGHAFNDHQTEAEKLLNGIHQIEGVIERYKEAFFN